MSYRLLLAVGLTNVHAIKALSATQARALLFSVE